MCGIVGIEFSDNVTKNNIFVWIKKTLTVSSRRGKDSSGISFITETSNNFHEVTSFKSENSIFELLKH